MSNCAIRSPGLRIHALGLYCQIRGNEFAIREKELSKSSERFTTRENGLSYSRERITNPWERIAHYSIERFTYGFFLKISLSIQGFHSVEYT